MDRKIIVITEMYDAVRSNERQDESHVVIRDEARVNTLYIENISSDTVIILAGEIIKGGKQDQVIAQDFLLSPNSGKTDVNVFCIEPHRWNANTGSNAEGQLHSLEVVQFKEYKKVASNKVRKSAVKDKSQTAVWGKVEEVVVQNDAVSKTGSYNALEESKDFKKEFDEYSGFFKNKFSNSNDVIGVIVMSGSAMIGCDIFYSPDLFRREYVNLLDAYITDAITYPVKSGDEVKTAESYFSGVAIDFADTMDRENSNKFYHGGKLIHYASF